MISDIDVMRIRWARRNGWKPSKIARLANVSPCHVSAICSRVWRREPRDIDRLAADLGMAPNE